MPITYPPAAPTLSGDFVTISRFLQNPTLVGRRLQEILAYRFLAERLMTRRLQVAGGAITWETGGEGIFANDDPRTVAPGSEYPLTTVPLGQASVAKTVKYGQDSIITDESIKRQLIDPVERTLTKMANSQVRYVDGIVLSAAVTAITSTQAVGGGVWATATAENILKDVATAKAAIINVKEGYDPDLVIVDELTYYQVWAKFLVAGLFPREANNPLGSDSGTGFPTVDGITWLPTPNLPIANAALLIDTSVFGGVADEDIGGPGYASAGVGGQVKTMRLDETDGWRVRLRRVFVPVVLEPLAARKITGVS